MPLTVIAFIVLISLIALPFAAFAIKRDHEYKLEREKIRAESRGSSLGTSELRGLIQEAMHDALAPVEERLDLIEMNTRRLPEHDAESKQVEAIHPDKQTEN